ncbi:phage tail protein [Serratia nevei]|uniref:phage tail protein n=1 Tax=Serratia marcescens TaxID=615 RepID=UPI00141D0097|nr:phage tail protein [Serratia marcescens]MDF8320705.1 phage tail protein [Serratia nevei]MDF8326219.1 phage tail protein [Serratia nevei]MDF8336326.1 phage tail protein [Serratia nevei]MDF8346072.1 phage tail protein [Serratia nevei]MDF8347359.1 phage tail protein [Serratia nevei]
MEKKYAALLTHAGEEKIADAAINGNKVNFTYMAVGDSGGNLFMPSKQQNGLINECYRSHLNSLQIVDSDKNIIEAEMIIPPNVGGFTMREIAIFDDSDTCIVMANMPETYKPLLDEGSGRVSVLRVWIAVSSTSSVELITDPGIIVATIEDVIKVGNNAKDYVDEALDQHEKSTKHPDATLKGKGFTQLSNATNSDSEKLAATPKAIKAAIAIAMRKAWELDNPVGSSRLFNQNLNPNELWPWSTWEYAGEHLTIRTAKADGSDVGTLGGSDTVNITRANLPQSVLNVSGSTSEQGAQTLQTTPAGRHIHSGKYVESNTSLDGGGSDRRSWSVNYDCRDEGLIGEAPDHQHSATVPAHAHTVWAQTEALGQGQAINVVERHKLQMLWHRVA